MWMLQARFIFPTCMSGATLTQTYWAWYRFVSSPSVSSPLYMPSLSSLRTCPTLSTVPSTPRLGILHSQGTQLSLLGTGHSLGTLHSRPVGTLHIQLQAILLLEDIHQPILGILQEVGVAIHHILQYRSLEEPDQGQPPASVQNTSRQASSLLWRTR